MGERLTIHTHNRLELLLAAMAERLDAAPLPPLLAETIVVPGQGMARWVTLQLAERAGTAASLWLPFPGAFLERLCGGAELDPRFQRPVLAMRLFRLLGDPQLQGELGPAAAYCRDDPGQHKRLQLAMRLAQCFDDYQLYRDDLLLAWQRGDAGDLPHARWQMRLWQELLREVGAAPTPGPGAAAAPAPMRGQGLLFAPAAAAPAAAAPVAIAHRLEHLRRLLADADRARAVLPPRLSVFGLCALPPAFVDLLVRIAEHVEVAVYAPKATPHYFGDVRRDRTGRPRAPGSGHPLLAAWGAQARQFFDLWLDRDVVDDDDDVPPFADPGTGCALHALQSDLLHLRVRQPRGDAAPLPLRADDDSVRVHSTHGPLREMEVLRDQLLAALQADATLRPSDVLVLLPDVAAYAPYVHAVFGPARRLLPFHLADRSPAAELPVPALFLRLCGLARGRFTAPELLLLLEEPALARRFDIARPDLLTLRTWVERTRIRWGLDGDQRRQDLGLPADDANTWRFGVDRLLLGVATGPSAAPVLDLLPAADATAGRTALLARFVRFVDAVTGACRALGRPHSLEVWAELLDRYATELFLALDQDESQGIDQLQAAARRLRQLHEHSALREELSAAAFKAWLEDDLLAQGDSRGFLCGAITFAALRPMRAVPMRVLAICGLGDGAFPRSTRSPAFDLLRNAPRPGDRNARDDDRQLFLDAVLAARDRLLLSWVGRSHKDNSECAPSPLVSELLEHLERAFTPPTGCRSVRAAVVVDHPLQAFSPRYGADDPRLFTYAAARRADWLPPAGAAPAADAPATTAPMLPAVGAAAGRERIAFADLLEFWRAPVRWFCRHRLDVQFPREDDRDDDAEPFALHNLDRYLLIDGAVRARLLGQLDPIATGAVLQTGMLPPGQLGQLERADLSRATDRFADRVLAARGLDLRTFTVIGGDWELHGELDGLRPDALVLWRSAKIKAKDRMRAFLHHAALCAAVEQGAELPSATVLIGLDGGIQAPPCSPALGHLDRLIDGLRQGRQSPLPFFDNSTATYVESLRKYGDPVRALEAARTSWLPPRYGDRPYLHDLPDPFLELCFGDRDPLVLPGFDRWARAAFEPALQFFDDEGKEP